MSEQEENNLRENLKESLRNLVKEKDFGNAEELLSDKNIDFMMKEYKENNVLDLDNDKDKQAIQELRNVNNAGKLLNNNNILI
jgi:hypothetical protein